MKRLIPNITLLVFMALGSMSAIAHDSTIKYGIGYLTMVSKLRMAKAGVGSRH